MVLALLANLLFLVGYFLLFTLLGGILFPMRSEMLGNVLWLSFFLLAGGSGYITYRLLFKIIRNTIPLEKFFDPYFLKNRWF